MYSILGKFNQLHYNGFNFQIRSYLLCHLKLKEDPIHKIPLPDSSKPKKSKKQDGTKINKFKSVTERVFDVFISKNLIDESEKSKYLAKIIPTDTSQTINSGVCEKWYTDTLNSLVERIVQVCNNRFRLSRENVVTLEDFRAQARAMVVFYDEYTDYIKSTLRSCAEASIEKKDLEFVPKHEPELPFRVRPKGQLGKLNNHNPKELFQALFDFFSKRKEMLQDQGISDSIERVTVHLWEQESSKLLSLSEGNAALDLCSQICILLKKGDFDVRNKKKKLNANIIQYHKSLRDECKKLAKIDYKNESLELKSVDNPSFPIQVKRGSPSMPSFLAIVPLLMDWMERYQTKSLLQKNSDLLLFVLSLRQLILHYADRKKLHEELVACEEVCTSLQLNEALEHPYEAHFKDGTFQIPAHQVQVLNKSSSELKKLLTGKMIRSPILLKWLTKEDFDTFYKALIDEPIKYTLLQLVAVINAAESFQISELAKSHFQLLLCHLDACADVSTLISMERIIHESKSLNPDNQRRWQEQRDLWVSEWLSIGIRIELIPTWLAYQTFHEIPDWCKVKTITLNKPVEQATTHAIARLPELTQLSIVDFSDTSPPEVGFFPKLDTLIITSNLQLNDNDVEVLQQFLSLPTLKNLDISCSALEKLLKVLASCRQKVSLKLRIPTLMTEAQVSNLQILKTHYHLTSLDITCKTIAPFVPLLNNLILNLRLIKPEKTEFTLIKDLPFELLEFGAVQDNFLPQVLALTTVSILCLGRTISKQLCEYVETDHDHGASVHPLKALEMKLEGKELRLLSRIVRNPVKELNIALVDPQPIEMTALWLDAFHPPFQIEATQSPIILHRTRSMPHSPTAYQEMDTEISGTYTHLFSEKLVIAGKWILGAYLCQGLVVNRIQQKVSLDLSPLENLSGTEAQVAEYNLVNALLAPIFPKTMRICLYWEHSDKISIWTPRTIKGKRTFILE